MSYTPPGYTPPSYTPPPSYFRQPPEEKNGLAIAALVLGIVTLVISLIPGVGILLGWLPGLLAIIFGLIAGIPDKVNRKLGLIGAGLAVLSVVVSVVWLIVLSAIGSSHNSSIDSQEGIGSSPSISQPASSSDSDSEAAPPSVPDGYKEATDGVYFKWGDSDSGSFSSTEYATIIAVDGCSSVWATANLMKGDTIVSSTYASASNIPAGGKAQLKFLSFDDDADSIKLTDLSCYHF